MEPLIKDPETGILYRKWCVEDPDMILLLVHGMGATVCRWNFMAEFFIRNNISSYALALKGFGSTPDIKGHIDSFDIYLDDILRLKDIIRKENTGKKIFLVGESMGGLITLLTGFIQPPVFDGLVCISPGIKSNMKFSVFNYLDFITALVYNPKKQIKMPFNSGMCTRDEEYRRVMDADCHEHRLASARLLWETLKAQIKCIKDIQKIDTDVLFLLADVDMLVDEKMNKKMFERIEHGRNRMIEYPGTYHALSIEKNRDEVFRDILKWIRG